jgi:hypothetical protein
MLDLEPMQRVAEHLDCDRAIWDDEAGELKTFSQQSVDGGLVRISSLAEWQ